MSKRYVCAVSPTVIVSRLIFLAFSSFLICVAQTAALYCTNNIPKGVVCILPFSIAYPLSIKSCKRRIYTYYLFLLSLSIFPKIGFE
jgi:hypothetical protein